MGRIVVNKHTNVPSGITQNNFVNPGEIVISNLKGEEDIYIINSENEPKGIRKIVEGDLIAFSGAVINNYYTKGDVDDKIADAESILNDKIEQTDENVRAYIGQEIEAVEGDIEAHYSAATAYTNTVSGNIETVTNDLYARISNLSGASSASYESVIGMIADVSAATRTLSGQVITLSAATENGISSAFTYVNEVSGYIETKINEIKEEGDGALSALSATVVAFSGSVESALSETLEEAKQYTDDAEYVNEAEYNSNDKKIYFKHDGTVITAATIDATDFIKDGMVSSVTITDIAESGSCLSITFNTDASAETINIPLTEIFNPNNYYTKDEIDDKHYVTSAQTKEQIEDYGYITATEANNRMDGIEESVSALSGNIINYVENNYLTSGETVAAINTASIALDDKIDLVEGELLDNILELSGATIGGISSAFSYTNEVSGNIENRINELETATTSAITVLSGDVISYVNSAITEQGGNLSELSGNVATLSGAVETLSGDILTYTDEKISDLSTALSGVSAVTATAIQNVRFEVIEEGYTIEQNGIKVKKDGTDVIIDVSDMTIGGDDYE